MKAIGIVSSILLCFVALPFYASDETADIQTSKFVPPKPIERVIPRYPYSPLIKGNEAWVYLIFLVNEEGYATDINVFDSLGGPPFEQAAIDALKQSRYSPATLDGNPIVARRSSKYTFVFGDEPRPASQGFRDLQLRLNRHIEQGNKERADRILQQLREIAGNLSEYALLGFTEFTYHRNWGSKEDQLEALGNAVAYESSARYLPEEMFIAALASKVVLEVQLQYFKSALSTYRKFVKVERTHDYFESSLAELMNPVKELAEKRSQFVMTYEFDKSGRWSYRLLWNTFALEIAAAPTSDLMLRCERESFNFPYESSIKYEISDSAGDCVLFVEGQPGTLVTLYQL